MNDTNEQVKDVKGIENDIWKIVGGDFSPDALGPEKYDAIKSRARSRVGEYIKMFESLFLGLNFDALMQSDLYLPTFLELLFEMEPDRVRKTAERLLKHYNAVLVIYDDAKDKKKLFKILPDETVRLFHRLEDRRIELRQLIKETN